MALIRRGPTILNSRTTGPLARQRGHFVPTVTLIGARELANVMTQVPKHVVSASVRIGLQRGIKVAYEEIKDHAERLPMISRRSYGAYARSLMSSTNMVTRFRGVGVVGNRKNYRDPGPYPGERFRRRPAKYWHFVEYGVRGGRGHHLIARAGMKALPKVRASFERAAIHVLSRHFNIPPLMMSAAISALRPNPGVRRERLIQ